MSLATLLVLADGRLPAGSHAHSAGVEVFVRGRELTDVAALRAFLRGRIATCGFVDATVAAAAAITQSWTMIDAEANARVAVPELRAVSRLLGRRLARTAGRCWPDERLTAVGRLHPDGPHYPVALGAAGVAAGLDALAVAVAAVHASATTPATAAVRLLGLDPVAVHAELAALAADIDRIAALAVAEVQCHGLRGSLAPAAPRSEMAAARHSRLEGRLFAS